MVVSSREEQQKGMFGRNRGLELGWGRGRSQVCNWSDNFGAELLRQFSELDFED